MQQAITTCKIIQLGHAYNKGWKRPKKDLERGEGKEKEGGEGRGREVESLGLISDLNFHTQPLALTVFLLSQQLTDHEMPDLAPSE